VVTNSLSDKGKGGTGTSLRIPMNATALGCQKYGMSGKKEKEIPKGEGRFPHAGLINWGGPEKEGETARFRGKPREISFNQKPE